MAPEPRSNEHADAELQGDLKSDFQQSGAAKPKESGTATADEAAVLFQPFKGLGRYSLRNRLVYAPLTRCRAIDLQKGPSTSTIPQPHMLTYYEQRARGSEGGLILTEGTSPSPRGHGFPNVPGIYREDQIAAWKPIVEAVHKHGATFFMQLWHVGRQSHTSYQPNGDAPLAPSAIAVKGQTPLNDGSMADYSVPKEMTKDDISALTQEFATAAKNAIAAGFDGVEIHGANGYILEAFLKTSSNRRTDEYGGSKEHRCRIVLEVVKAVTDAVGSDRVGIRFSPYSTFGDISDANPDETYSYLTEQLNKYGLAYVHFVEPRIAGNADIKAGKGQDTGIFRNIWKGPFISAGGYTRQNAIKALKSGHADLVCFGRRYLSNPDLPNRFRKNAELNAYDRNSFYTSDPVKGYTDYPFLDEANDSA